MELRDGDLREEPTGKLIHDLFDESKRVIGEGTRLLRTEVDSAKAELRGEAKKLGPAAALAGSGGAVMHAGLLMLGVAVGALLAQTMPAWAAFVVTSAIFFAAGGALLFVARKRIAEIELKPVNAIQTLQEDKRWAKELTQSNR